MSTGKTSAFYLVLIAVAGMAVGMVITSRLDLAPSSAAQTVAVPAINSAPLTRTDHATTVPEHAKINAPRVVNIQTQVRQRRRELTEFFGGGGRRTICCGASSAAKTPRPAGPSGRRNRHGAAARPPVMEGAGTGSSSTIGPDPDHNHVVEARSISASASTAPTGSKPTPRKSSGTTS